MRRLRPGRGDDSVISTVAAPAGAAGASLASTNDLALIAVLTFIALVIQKEATGATPEGRQGDLARGLNIGIVPLGLAFAVIVGVRLAQMFALLP
jgi:hypothetical protein